MGDIRMTSEHRREDLSFSCVLVSAVFFLVLSQAFILRVPEVVTQIFRPMIVFFLIIKMMQRGQVNFSARSVALVAAIYCTLIIFFVKVNANEIMQASATSLYLLMFWVVCGTPWNRREVRFIIKACFAGAIACAVFLFVSNDPTNLSVGASGDMKMLGMHVNRNKNAYAFSTGTVIGIIYLLHGKNIKKFWACLLTAIVAYALLYSQCRGAFFCAVAGTVIVVTSILLKVKKQDQGKFVLYSALFVLFCVLAYYLLKNSQLSRLIDGDSTSGRDEGIKYAWNLFLSGDLFGKIFGNGYGFEAAHTEGVGAHLVYATYLLSIGLVGCLMITSIFILTGLGIRGSIPHAFWTCAFLRTFFEGLDYYIYIPLILSIIIYNYSSIHRRNCVELFSGK